MKHELNSYATKKLLSDAMIQLVEKKSFSKITVSEISSICNINRKTFYYHFTDIYDLLKWHLNEEIEKSLNSLNSVYDFDSTITYAAKYIKQHPYLLHFIEDPIGREKVSLTLNKVIMPLAIDLLKECEKTNHKELDPDFKEFLAINLTRIVVLSILDNIENPDIYDIEKLKRYISIIFDMSQSGFFK